MQLNVLNDLAKAKRALDGKKQAAKFALGAPGWGLGFRTVLYWFCPYRLGYGDRVMWCSVLLCLLFAITNTGDDAMPSPFTELALCLFFFLARVWLGPYNWHCVWFVVFVVFSFCFLWCWFCFFVVGTC